MQQHSQRDPRPFPSQFPPTQSPPDAEAVKAIGYRFKKARIGKGKRITFLRKSTVSKSIFIRIKRVLSLEHERVRQKMPSASMPTREEMQMMETVCSQVTTISYDFTSKQ